ncbi:MAG: SBBP repeat-containing protein [Ignavibacteria bacterium]
MKKASILLLFFLAIGSLHSQWVANYWGNESGDINIVNAKGMAITNDNSGKCYVAGYIQSPYSGNDIAVIKYSQTGDTLWTRTYNGQGNSEDKAFGIVTDNIGNVYVTGSVTVQGRGLQLILLKYSSSGSLVWNRVFGATENNTDDEGLAITLDNSGFPIVTGYCTNNDGLTDFITIKYSPNGTQIFNRKFDGPENLGSKAYGIVVDSDNFIYVTGYITTSESQEDIAVIKYSPLGIKIWAKKRDGGSEATDKAFGIAVDQNDNIYVTGYVSPTSNTQNTDAVLLKYSSNGSFKWEKTYNGEGGTSEDKAWGIIVDDDKDRVYITGQTSTVNNGLDYLTVDYTYTGTEKWVSKYNGPGNGSDIANAIALLPGNKVIVTGASWGTNQNHDYATVKMNNNGAITETQRYSMSGNSEDVAKDISVSGNNNSSSIYVTGYSELIIDGHDNSSVISTVMIKDENTSKEESVNQPESFVLHQNFPNPFNPSTVIQFDLSESANVKLVVYDMLGKVVDILADRYMEKGSYSINYTNKNLSTGIYFYEFSAGSYRDIKKMSLIK